MKKFLFILFTISLLSKSFAQENIFTTESFIIKLSGSNLFAENLERKIVFEKSFYDPRGFVVDMDNDGNVEFLVNDAVIQDSKRYYITYIYNTVNSFHLIDSIYSGLREPYYTFSYELNKVILITGSPDFDSLNAPQLNKIFSPLVCWAIIGNELGIVNDRLYDIFISENEKYIEFADSLYKTRGSGCNTSFLIRSIIAAIFVNYIYADEKAVADKSLNKYYECDDKVKFKEAIEKLL